MLLDLVSTKKLKILLAEDLNRKTKIASENALLFSCRPQTFADQTFARSTTRSELLST